MNTRKITLGALFFLGTSTTLLFAQEKKKETEKDIEEVSIKATSNKKTETAILQDQKKAIIQKQSIGAEEISRKGISNIEQGLTKMTGITTVASRGIFVRGLEERYNTLLVNGLATPSNNPFQKIIALKQFPTDIVGKLDVYKTFNADLYGDFAGATFNVETLVPETQFTKIEFSIGVNTQNTFRDHFKMNKNANTIEGYVGENYKDRLMPDVARNNKPNYTYSKSESLSLFNDSWSVDNVKTLPNTGIGLTHSGRKKFDTAGTLGYLLSLNQSNEYSYKSGADNYIDGSGQYQNKLAKTEYNYNIQSSALVGMNYKINNTKLDLGAFYLQNADNFITDLRGFRNGERTINEFIRTNQMDISRFIDVQGILTQKFGERHSVKVGGSWVYNSYMQPDRKIMLGTYDKNTPNSIVMSYGGNNLIRQYLELSGKDYWSGLAEYQLNLGEREGGNYPVVVTLGANGYKDFRDSSYRFIFGRLNNNAVNGQETITDIDGIQNNFNRNIQNDIFHFQEGSTGNYRAFLYQLVQAGYATVNYKPTKQWDILLGLRTENSQSLIKYREVGDVFTAPYRRISKNQTFFLPSISIKRGIGERSNLRFAASKTITRPILIETFPISYINPDNETIQGNPNIKNSENYNIDLKFESFPTKKEFFAVNIFAKRIVNAIERTNTAAGNSNGRLTTFYNAKHADILGIELEGVIDLERVAESLNGFTFGANTTIMYSNVERSQQQEQETDYQAGRKRALQGAAPWTVNADLKYEMKSRNNLKHTASLVYNVSGKKIYSVGSFRLDNFYEMPFSQLDFVWNSELSKNWNVKLGINNILNQQYRLELGDRSIVKILESSLRMEDYRKGTSFNLSVGYKF